jgi:hypothetical protein
MATELEKFKHDGYVQPRMTVLSGIITIGAAGAISAQSGQQVSGVTFTKNATAGRYDGVMHRGYKRTVGAMANVISPTAGNVPVVTDGNLAYVNGIAATNVAATAAISTFTIQCCTSNGVATAANPKSGDMVNWFLEVSDL